MNANQRAYKRAHTPQSFARKRYETRTFSHCISYTVRGMDVDVDCTVTYQIVPPAAGAPHPSVELVDVVVDRGNKDEPMTEYEFDQFEDELIEAAYSDLESLPSAAEVC